MKLSNYELLSNFWYLYCCVVIINSINHRPCCVWTDKIFFEFRYIFAWSCSMDFISILSKFGLNAKLSDNIKKVRNWFKCILILQKIHEIGIKYIQWNFFHHFFPREHWQTQSCQQTVANKSKSGKYDTNVPDKY